MASASLVIVVFLVAIVLFHVVLIWLSPFRITEIGWKRVDYLWLSMAMISVLGLSGEARQYFSERMLRQSEAGFNYIVADVLGVLPSWAAIPCDPPFIRSEYSPENFDEVLLQYREYCAWLTSKQEELTKIVEGRQAVDLTYFAQGAQFLLVADIAFEERYLRQLLQEYNVRLLEIQELSIETQKSELEVATLFYAPVVLAIALALRLTKVSGEIWWYRRRKTQNQ